MKKHYRVIHRLKILIDILENFEIRINKQILTQKLVIFLIILLEKHNIRFQNMIKILLENLIRKICKTIKITQIKDICDECE